MDDNDFDTFSSFEPDWFYSVGIHGDSTAPKEANDAALQAVPSDPFAGWEDAEAAASRLSLRFPGVLVGVWRVTLTHDYETNSADEKTGDLYSVWLCGEEKVFSEVIK